MITNFRYNYPSIETEAECLKKFANSFSSQQSRDVRIVPPFEGDTRLRDVIAKELQVPSSLYPRFVNVVNCSSGNHALMTAMQILRPQYDTILVEGFTYSAFKSIAQLHGVKLVPCDQDEDGITIESLEENAMSTQSKILYLQPTLHNPTCHVMPARRRKDIAALVKEKGLTVIEDDAYRFLHPSPPATFLSMIPEQTIHIFSLSKPFNPLVKSAFMTLPSAMFSKATDAIRINSSGGISSFFSPFVVELIESGDLQKIILNKRKIGSDRQEMVRDVLEGLDYRTSDTSFHLWLRLPKGMDSTVLTVQLEQEDILISDGKLFSVKISTEEQQHVRLSLGAEEDKAKIREGLQKIKHHIQRTAVVIE